MAQMFGIEIANSSLKKLEPTFANELELQEAAPILPKSASNIVEVPKIDEDRILIASNENLGSKEPSFSAELRLEVESSILKGYFFISANMTYLA